MKLNLPGLYDGGDLMSMPGQDPAQAAQVILPVINLIHGRASKVVETEDRLNRGLVDPCWAFAICYAAQLLISHGDGILRDSNWFQRVAELKTTLDKVSKRWKIAGELLCFPSPAAGNGLLTCPRRTIQRIGQTGPRQPPRRVRQVKTDFTNQRIAK